MTRSEPPAEVITDALLERRLSQILAGTSVLFDVAELEAIIRELQSLRTSSSLGGIEGGVARAEDSAPHPDEPLITGNAMGDIAAERRRQVEVEGWTAEHDDRHALGELAKAAACYAIGYTPKIEAYSGGMLHRFILWPWAQEWWKPKRARRNLVKAGALIVAEIERMDRIKGSA